MIHQRCNFLFLWLKHRYSAYLSPFFLPNYLSIAPGHISIDSTCTIGFVSDRNVLRILNISNPSTLTEIASYPARAGGSVYRTFPSKIQPTQLYVCEGAAGFTVLDISDVNTPKILKTHAVEGMCIPLS